MPHAIGRPLRRASVLVGAAFAFAIGLHVERPATAVPAVTGGIRQDGVVRGMTVSCPTWGWEWGSDAMVQTLDELAALGVGWVAIHPYAGIGADGAVAWTALDPAAPPAWIARPIAEAHARGMKILIKPHIAYWGSPWSWRGAIDLDPAQTARFFADYIAWMGNLAAASVGADAFAVGTELDKTLGAEAEWRAVIAAVRARFPGPLTYAANWTDYARVPFWDALDAIGVQAYFPLVSRRGVPTDAQLDAGWDAVLGDLRAVSERVGKPVVFTELGYNRSAQAAREPWRYETGGADADAIQQACLRAALRAIDREPAVVGAFLWKWFPGSIAPRDFDSSAPPIRALIRAAWGGPEVSAPP